MRMIEAGQSLPIEIIIGSGGATGVMINVPPSDERALLTGPLARAVRAAN